MLRALKTRQDQTISSLVQTETDNFSPASGHYSSRQAQSSAGFDFFPLCTHKHDWAGVAKDREFLQHPACLHPPRHSPGTDGCVRGGGTCCSAARLMRETRETHRTRSENTPPLSASDCVYAGKQKSFKQSFSLSWHLIVNVFIHPPS